MDSKLGRTRVATMRPPLTSTLFPLGELSLHQLHTPSDGDMFVTADVAVTVFGETPALFADFIRANRYERVNAMDKAVVRLCLSLGIPAETAGGDKQGQGETRTRTSTAASASTTTGSRQGETTGSDGPDDTRDGPIASTDAVTLLPEKTVLAIFADRRRVSLVVAFRETAMRNAFEASSKFELEGDLEKALPLALDAVRRAQEIYETPRAKLHAASREREEASVKNNQGVGMKEQTKGDGTETTSAAPSPNLFEPYLLAARVTLGLGKTNTCENLCGLASWICDQRAGSITSLQKSRLHKTRGDLRLAQWRKQDALTEFAKQTFHVAEAFGPQTPHVAVALFELANAFRMKEMEATPCFIRDEDDSSSVLETDSESDSAGDAERKSDGDPTHAAAATRCEASAVKIWMAAAADAAGVLTETSDSDELLTPENSSGSAFAKTVALSLAPETRRSFAETTEKELARAVSTLRFASARADELGDLSLSANALLAAGLVTFALVGRYGRKEKSGSDSRGAFFSLDEKDAGELIRRAAETFPVDDADAKTFARTVLDRVGV